MRYVQNWVWWGSQILIKTSLGNIVYMVFLISWFSHLGIPHERAVLCLLTGDVVHPLVKNVLFPLHRLFLFIFIFWSMNNSVVRIKLCWFIIVIVHSLLLVLSFNFLPILTWCAPYHSVCLGDCLLVPYSPSFASLACVAVDELAPMWTEISLWIPFWNISLPPYLLFLFKCLVWLSLVSCSILDQAWNGSCLSFVGICQFFVWINELDNLILLQ